MPSMIDHGWQSLAKYSSAGRVHMPCYKFACPICRFSSWNHQPGFIEMKNVGIKFLEFCPNVSGTFCLTNLDYKLNVVLQHYFYNNIDDHNKVKSTSITYKWHFTRKTRREIT